MSQSLEEYQGMCPVCRLTLHREAGNLVVCADGHYSAKRIEYERMWNKFNAFTDSADRLLEELIELNMIKDTN